MGLDLVELTLTVEEAFGVRIPDDRAAGMLRVGDLYEFLIEETGKSPRKNEVCLSAATFFAIRRALHGTTPNAKRLRPSDAVIDALPSRGRRATWKSLATTLDLKLPWLSRPAWVAWPAAAAVVTASGYFASTAFQIAGVVGVFPAFFFGAMVLTLLAALATEPLATIPGARIRRLRDLTQQVLALNYSKLSKRYDAWSREGVWDALQNLVVDQLGVRRELVTPEASWTGDLGAD